MDKEKFVKSDVQYLDLAKQVTAQLHDICIENEEKYNLLTVLSGVSIGFYMFLKEISQNTDIKTSDLIKECSQWVHWADSKFNKLN